VVARTHSEAIHRDCGTNEKPKLSDQRVKVDCLWTVFGVHIILRIHEQSLSSLEIGNGEEKSLAGLRYTNDGAHGVPSIRPDERATTIPRPYRPRTTNDGGLIEGYLPYRVPRSSSGQRCSALFETSEGYSLAFRP